MRSQISLSVQASPQKSLKAPSTVAASIELVPMPDPAGKADKSVISMPAPNSRSCSRSEGKESEEKPGANPARASAALGMEKGEPTRAKSRSDS